MSLTLVLTASGRLVPLLAPMAEHIDLEADVAPPLARIARFAGHVPGGPYSVAQHSVLGAEAIFAETGRPDLALAFLLHDAHEAYLGDITRPAAAALEARVARGAPGGSEVAAALASIRYGLDMAIRGHVGLTAPPTREEASAVDEMDRRMLATEFRQLFPPAAMPGDLATLRPVPLNGAIRPWPWPQAADQWLTALRRWHPSGWRT